MTDTAVDSNVIDIKAADFNKEYVKPLGYAGKAYFYTSSANPQINTLREHTETEFYRLMPREYWLKAYGKDKVEDGKPPKRTIFWPSVKSELMALCHKVGVFDNTRVRGAGVWKDGTHKALINLGDRLSTEETELDLRGFQSHSIYEYGLRLPGIIGLAPLEIEDLAHLTDALKLVNYAHPEQMLFLGGWLACAPICGVLDWRAHIWLTGEQGSGKTTILDDIIKPLLNGFSCHHFQGATTEAGIRQTIKSSALPILFDEFEITNDTMRNKHDNVMGLIRQASSDTGGEIVKGSATGEAVRYRPRFSACMSSIRVNLPNDSDKSRVTPVELKKNLGKESAVKFEELRRKMAHFDKEFCRRFFARQIQMVPIILRNQTNFQKIFATKHSNRFGQQYGTLLAGWASLIYDRVLTDIECGELVSQVNLDREEASSGTPDHEECFLYMMEKEFRIGGIDDRPLVTTLLKRLFVFANEKKTMAYEWDLLNTPGKDKDAFWKETKTSLGELGIAPAFLKDKGPGLVFTHHPIMDEIFKGTKWAINWTGSLKRLRGAGTSKVVRILGKQKRGVFVPIEHFIDLQ